MPGENYLCFTAEENINISWVVHGILTETPELLYSIDSMNDWQNYILGTTISLSLGHQCYWKSTTKTFSESANDYITFVSTGKVAASGVIDSLRDFVTGLDSFGYYKMFENCIGLTTAPELPSDFLSNNVYSYMFAGCTSLKVAPALPANYINVSCYENMFYGCTSLVQAPELPCNFLSENCYRGMFEGCTSLIQAPRLNASNLAVRCYYGMFDGCSNLATLPELPAHQLKTECYKFMFRNCSKIKLSAEQTGEYQRAYKIPSGSGSTTTAVGALDSMFYGTGGTFTNNPTIDVTYYTSNSAPEPVDYNGVIDGNGLLKLGRMVKDHIRNTSASKDIEGYIPSQASSQNQLADKNFVNSSIENVAAYYITKNAAGDPFATKAELTSATVFYSGGEVRVPTRNDYTVVLADESKTITETGEDPTTRYIYGNDTWSYQYIVNNSGLTAAQWAAVTSNITALKVTGYDNHLANTNNPHGVTKEQIGLGNVDNTSDAQKTVLAASNYVQGGTIEEVLDSKITAPSSPVTGQFLKKTSSGWETAEVDALPSQTGQSGKYLTTDGESASWNELSAIRKVIL